jgi:putative tryptophan/tyrosine transport system substrate-binding protein
MAARRTMLSSLVACLATAAFPALAQPAGKVWRIGFLSNPLWSASVPEVERVAKSLKLEIQRIEARPPGEFAPAFAAAVEKRADALVVVEDSLFTGEASTLAALALKHKLPAIGQVVFAEAGSLIGNGTNQLVLFRRAAVFVDKILKGAKPADLPIEQATRFELIANLKTRQGAGRDAAEAADVPRRPDHRIGKNPPA